ncbi:riboflavin biosynthesis protein RibF [Solemya pervernicosa gill symbiont]|uniref:Riboflavin biosynthesis protein n=2 Tax=Gammaproteobacteria incertae sedis TaxID=118884 RepID=A0A1T2L8B7_9GAMM|nr:bifunctional riboflavin kinase/FAD synthetase [Candidatus Reidiella endopervernicosa]OOZ41348.1 riboflavin biosynthesis protein RibF [Solemya pervernicosa gill symbiont]QKQ27726.1 bifunctional riboflavin kinase/FAD synthetase [Candidatus Reidiella endopervernicosa]
MELIRGIHNLRTRHRGCVATIGNFDGVHLGHQAVLGQLAEQAEEYGLPTQLITFDPQPQEFFRPDQAPARLTRLREKLLALRRFSVDRVLCTPFDQRLANMEAEQFIEQILVEGLGVRYLVVGDDFRFGKGRRGDFEMLRLAGERHGFPVVSMHTFNIDAERVSSTRIREALGVGDLVTAEKLLGRPYRMSGRVAHGDKLGRTIGFPTANIHLHRKATPVDGVFAVEVFGVEGEPVHGVANVGTRPTVNGTRSLLEIHLFDFSSEIYGHYINVDFLQRIRPEQRFESFDALKQQIDRDVDSARTFFASRD